MYSGSTEFNNLIGESGGNALITRFTFSDFSIEKFIKLEYYGGSNNSDDIAIGITNMAYLDVSTITDKLITNQEFLFEVGMELSDETIEYAPMGYFKVQSPDSDEDIVNFKAYDRMQKFEKPYVSSLAYPTDSSQILNELCTMCGVELATPIANPITITDKLDGYTCREVLGYIAGIHGFFACFDRYGKLNVRWYRSTPIEKQIGLIWSLTKSQINYTVEKITIAKDTENTYTSGTGISGINHSNPYATQEIADSIYTSLGNFTYRPCEISMLDDIRLDPWDMLKVTYLDGSVLTIPVMSLEHSFTSGETRVKSFGKTDTENEYSYSGPVTQAMDRMSTELLVANRIIATKVDAEWVNAHTVTADKIEATNARVSILEATSLTAVEADLRYANITLANIDTANVDVANIGLLFTKVGLIDRATIVDGHITGFLDAVEINANNITAGTLIADRILLKGSESGLLYALNNLGELTSTEVDTLDGTILTQRTVTADKLIANSITANELDVTNIFGNSAVLSTLVSQQAFIDAISTNSIVVGASNTANNALNAVSNISPLINGTQTAATGSWTGIAPFEELKDGQTILYCLPYNGSGNASLKLTLANGSSTGALPIYYQGNSRVTTHYIAGAMITMTYRKDVTIGNLKYTGWWTTVDNNTYDRTRYSGAIKASAAIVAGNIIVGNSSGYHHLNTGGTFDISYPILYAGSAIASGQSGTNNYIIIPMAITTTQSLTLTVYKGLYIKGKLSGNTFTPISTTPITQTIPTTEDGYDYIFIGTAYGTTTFYLLGEHPVFRFINGSFQQIGVGANNQAQGIINNIYTPNTTTIDGGKITTNSIKASSIDVNNLFAQDITATGKITGATLKGAHVESDSGRIGGWDITSDKFLKNTEKQFSDYIGDYIAFGELGSDGWAQTYWGAGVYITAKSSYFRQGYRVIDEYDDDGNPTKYTEHIGFEADIFGMRTDNFATNTVSSDLICKSTGAPEPLPGGYNNIYYNIGKDTQPWEKLYVREINVVKNDVLGTGGNISAQGDIIAGYGTSNQVSLLSLNSKLTVSTTPLSKGQIKIQGNIVNVNINTEVTATSAGINIGKVPNGYEPEYVILQGAFNNINCWLQVNTDGNLYVVGSGKYRGNCTYIV